MSRHRAAWPSSTNRAFLISFAGETSTFAPVTGSVSIAPAAPTVLNLMHLTKAITLRLGELQLAHAGEPFLLAPWPSHERYKVGQEVAGHTLTNQLNVSAGLMDYSMTQDEIRQRYVEPVAQALFGRIQREQARVFAPLGIPSGAFQSAEVRDSRSGLCVRGVADHRIGLDDDAVRFDILFGRAPKLTELAWNKRRSA